MSMPHLRKSLALLMLISCLVPADQLLALEETFSAGQIEWFEREVRPLLSQHCLSCHSKSVGTKGGLSLDSRESILAGGDSGPAIVPGKPDESLLIEAIRRESFEMPPEKALSARDQKTLEQWVALGAPWPSETASSSEEGEDWLSARANQHWAWKPLTRPDVPVVEGDHWSESAIDRFVYSRLQQEQLTPTTQSDTLSLARRLNFDLLGLPPTGDSELHLGEYESYVDSLISSPQFGVRWGRHWLDVVRYAETLGHEFDYPVHHAWRYREALMDSINTDVPYDQLLLEHVAGDSIDKPRLHPTTGINQSLALTGFWFLGDSVHAPVDVEQDWATRVDNQIDVFSKTFMGMTFACARCHDHKFDAISQADYYSLAGMLESTRREYVITDPNHRIASHTEEQIASLEQANQQVNNYVQDSKIAATEAQNWLNLIIEKLDSLEDKDRKQLLAFESDLHLLKFLLSTDADHAKEENWKQDLERLSRDVSKRSEQYDDWLSTSDLLADFSKGLPDDWTVTSADESYLKRPDLDWFSAPFPVSGNRSLFSSKNLGTERHLTLRSQNFELTKPVVCIETRGEDCTSTVVVCNFFMTEFHNLLFGDTRKKINQKSLGWLVHRGDVNKYVGQPTFLSIEDAGKGWFDIQEVRVADTPPPPCPSPLTIHILQQKPNSKEELTLLLAEALVSDANRIATDEPPASNLLVTLGNVSREHQVALPRHLSGLAELAQPVQAFANKMPAPTYVLAAQEGSPRNVGLAIRGNPHQRGETIERAQVSALNASLKHDLESQEARDLPKASSGRKELAELLVQPNNPLTARVIVNRVWHHLMGRGLVDSPDNLGVLGGRPSHPDLLDYLALELIDHNWSIKWLVHEIVLSKTYRLSVQPTELQKLKDPQGDLLSHRTVRRLSAEALRDALLTTSDSIDFRITGPSVPIHLNDQMTGRGRPSKSGPLDGAGRRSAFVEVRRNFLDPFLLAFDFPMPSTSAGDRTASNVPAQALGLLNDPLVTELVSRWTEQGSKNTEPENRIRDMIAVAYSRPATQQEVEQCLAFVEQNGESAWQALAHVLVNSKEFSYLR